MGTRIIIELNNMGGAKIFEDEGVTGADKHCENAHNVKFAEGRKETLRIVTRILEDVYFIE